MNEKQSKGLFQRPPIWLAILTVVTIVGISYATISNQLNESPINLVYDVQQGPLTISASVSGTIQAREKVIISSKLEGNNTIIYLIPEGTRVKKGDLLVELDISSMEDKRIDQQISVQNAEASYVSARENLAVVENQSQSDIDLAELDYQFAQLDLKKYMEGEFPKVQKETESKITLNEEKLVQAQEDLKWSEILFKEKYLAYTDLQRDQLLFHQAQLNLDTSKADLSLLNEFTSKRDLAQFESDVKQTKMALERTIRKSRASIVQASAELLAKKSEYDRQVSKLEKVIMQIGYGKIYAPMDGLAVYATSVQMNFRGNNEPLEEGSTVRERQDLIHLPTTSSYMAEVKVQESSLDKIRPGLPVRITVDAIPGKFFTGLVDKIAPLPDAQSRWMNPDFKVYNTEILIDGDGEELRSGMSCRAEIIIDQYEDALYVPVQAVLRIGGKPTVYIAQGDKWEPREVELGLDNNRVARIISGLKKGEKVLLTPPLSSAELSEDNANMDEASSQKIEDTLNKLKEQDASGQGPADTNRAPEGMNGQSGRGGTSPEGMGGQGGRRGFLPEGMSGGQGGRMGRSSDDSGQGERAGRGGRGGTRPNMTPEQREEMRKRFENMSEEEREAMRNRFRQGRESSSEGGGPSPSGNRGDRGAEQ